jgi:hypothetical protein
MGRLTKLIDAAMAIISLKNLHRFIGSTPLIGLSYESLVKLLDATHALSTSAVSDNLGASWYSSESGSPVSTSDRDGAIGLAASGLSRGASHMQGVQYQKDVIRQFSKSKLVLDILDIQGILLGQALVGGNSIETSVQDAGLEEENRAVKHRINDDRSYLLLTGRAVPSTPRVIRLEGDAGRAGSDILESIVDQTTDWWEDVMHGHGIGIGSGIAGRHSSSAGVDDLENSVIEAILVSLRFIQCFC